MESDRPSTPVRLLRTLWNQGRAGALPEVESNLRKLGIEECTPLQSEAMNAIDSGGNVVVCGPTGCGKSLVADMTVVRALCGFGKSAIVAVPFVALVQEQARRIR